MTLAADFLRLFTEGWAQYLADAGLGLTWKPSAPYTTAEAGIWLMSFPTDPEFDGSTAVALTPYPMADDPHFADSTVGLQVKSRCPGRDPRAVWALDNTIGNTILGRYPLDLPNGVHISTLLDGVNSTSLGRDEHQRPIWSTSYPFRVLKPGAFRL